MPWAASATHMTSCNAFLVVLTAVLGMQGSSSDNAVHDSAASSSSEWGFDDVDDFEGAPFWQFDAGGDEMDPNHETCTTAGNCGGRPSSCDQVDRVEFVLACEAGMYETELVAEFAIDSVYQVRRLKRKWGLHGVAEAARSNMPSLEQLQQWFQDDPSLTVEGVAEQVGASSTRALRRYFQRIGFEPFPKVDDNELITALLTIQTSGWCSDLGVTFAAARLRTEFGLVPGGRQLRRCLQLVNPAAHERRAAQAAAVRYVYTVAGPRYAHEKLAKIWGFWFHLCIDGYSRFILYLTCTDNKLAECVGQIFVTACNTHGWASRVRWDRGKENVCSIQAQLEYWWDHALSDVENEKRGSALTGRSMQNCRAEYIWGYAKKHVTSFFRKTFVKMEKELGILDPDDPWDLYFLHTVFMSLIQRALDDFREMWNNHLIRGERTEMGHGGGIPVELFTDPVMSASVRNADDATYEQDPNGYGVDEPFKGDTTELDKVQAHVEDPLIGWPTMQRVRTMFFVQFPFSSSDGIDDYVTFKLVTLELLEWLNHYAAGGDWPSFVATVSPWPSSDALIIRSRIEHIAQQF